jgi:hypothetical protein
LQEQQQHWGVLALLHGTLHLPRASVTRLYGVCLAAQLLALPQQHSNAVQSLHQLLQQQRTQKQQLKQLQAAAPSSPVKTHMRYQLLLKRAQLLRLQHT